MARARLTWRERWHEFALQWVPGYCKHPSRQRLFGDAQNFYNARFICNVCFKPLRD